MGKVGVSSEHAPVLMAVSLQYQKKKAKRLDLGQGACAVFWEVLRLVHCCPFSTGVQGEGLLFSGSSFRSPGAGWFLCFPRSWAF